SFFFSSRRRHTRSTRDWSSDVCSSDLAIIYVAHLGQAKSDAGTGYELMAIAAVVLGGASIFGGRGTILGTVLGLFAIVILQNGLRLSGQPAELAGILTGALLIGTIAIDRISKRAATRTVAQPQAEELDLKNSHVAILSAVILTAALIVVAGNWLAVKSLRDEMHSATPVAVAKG